MKFKKENFIFVLIFIVFLFFSIRPAIFSFNFFMYMIQGNNPGNYDSSLKYLIKVIWQNPAAYESIIKKNKAVKAVFLNTIIHNSKEFIDIFNKKDMEIIGKRYSSSIFLRKVIDENFNYKNLVFKSGLDTFIFKNREYNNLSKKLIDNLSSNKKIKLILKIKNFLSHTDNIKLYKYAKQLVKPYKKK